MLYRFAKRLHNGVQIRINETKEVTNVIDTEVQEKDVWVYAVTNENGYTKLHHKEIQ